LFTDLLKIIGWGDCLNLECFELPCGGLGYFCEFSLSKGVIQFALVDCFMINEWSKFCCSQLNLNLNETLRSKDAHYEEKKIS
jgi:hypothetical protein